MARNDDILFAKIAIKNNLVTEDQVNKCMDVQNKLAQHGKTKSLPQILSEIGFLKVEQVEKIQKAQEKSKKIQRDVMLADRVVEKGHTDRKTTDGYLTQTKEEDFKRSVGEIFVEEEIITADQLESYLEEIDRELEAPEENIDGDGEATPQPIQFSPKEETMEINSEELARNIEEVKAVKSQQNQPVASPEKLTSETEREETKEISRPQGTIGGPTTLPPLKKKSTTTNGQDMSSFLEKRQQRDRLLKILGGLALVGLLLFVLGGGYVAYHNYQAFNTANYHFSLQEYDQSEQQLEQLWGTFFVDVQQVNGLREDIAFKRKLVEVIKLLNDENYLEALNRLKHIESKGDSQRAELEETRGKIHLAQAEDARDQKKYSQAFRFYKMSLEHEGEHSGEAKDSMAKMVNQLYRLAKKARAEGKFEAALERYGLIQQNALNPDDLWEKQIQFCHYQIQMAKARQLMKKSRLEANALRKHLQTIRKRAGPLAKSKEFLQFEKFCQKRLQFEKWMSKADSVDSPEEKIKHLKRAMDYATPQQSKWLNRQIAKLKKSK